MIVGSKDIDFTALKKACTDVDTLERYTLQLVPPPLRHIQAIVDNQKYYVAVLVRSLQSLPYQHKKDLCEGLLAGVRVRGVPDALHDYSDLLLAIDAKLFEQYLKEENRRAQR